MTHRWLKFWPQDWQRDPALRSCSIAARGLWIEMLCVMHDGQPYGHLTINGKAASTKQIASIASVSEKDAAKLLAELEEGGVFSRDDAGTIFSRRMVRDKAVSDKASIDGKAGGNPALKATKLKLVKGGGNAPPITGGDNPPGKPTPYEGVQALEAEADTREDSVLRTGAAAPPLDARAVLWSEGLALVGRLTGKPPNPSRALLGRLLKPMADDCAGLLAILHDAEEARPIDPVPWLVAAVQTRSGARASPRKAENDAFMAEWLAGFEPTDRVRLQ